MLRSRLLIIFIVLIFSFACTQKLDWNSTNTTSSLNFTKSGTFVTNNETTMSNQRTSSNVTSTKFSSSNKTTTPEILSTSSRKQPHDISCILYMIWFGFVAVILLLIPLTTRAQRVPFPVPVSINPV